MSFWPPWAHQRIDPTRACPARQQVSPQLGALQLAPPHRSLRGARQMGPAQARAHEHQQEAHQRPLRWVHQRIDQARARPARQRVSPQQGAPQLFSLCRRP